MKKISSKENQLVFSAEIDESLANAVRRYLAQIPIVAIDEVEISKNDSPLYDETVAQRMGLIPLKMPSGSVKDKEFKMKLVSSTEGFVKSGEIKGDLKVVYEEMPITFLNKGQEIEMTAVAKAGKGSQHSKFTPGLMFYRNSSEITLDKEFLNEIKSVFPKVEVKEKGNKIIVSDSQKEEVADFCDGLAQKSAKEIEIKYNPELIITLESFGQIAVDDIFKKAIEELQKDLEKVEKEISK